MFTILGFVRGATTRALRNHTLKQTLLRGCQTKKLIPIDAPHASGP